MSDSLFQYYEQELGFLRQMSREFAQAYPAAAGRLGLTDNLSADPHVERMIESFALLAGRIHKKLDDDFPELTEALLQTLYPHYLAPIPSMATVGFEIDPARGQFPNGFVIPRGSMLSTPPVDNVPCRFRTCQDVVLWPLTIDQGDLHSPPFPSRFNLTDPPPGARGLLRLRLSTLGRERFPELNLTSLRIGLNGDSQTIATLYELILNSVIALEVRWSDGPDGPGCRRLNPREHLKPVGFDPEQAMLPYPARSLPAYRLLTEFFTFPSKFWFFDLLGLEPDRYQTNLEILFYLREAYPALEQRVGPSSFSLGSTPIINLFPQTAEPIVLTHTRSSYPIVPDVSKPRGLEVYSIDWVGEVDIARDQTLEYLPFYSFNHRVDSLTHRAFWHASRVASESRDDIGTDLNLMLVNLDFQPTAPAESVLVVKTTCTNRDLPMKLAVRGDRVQFTPEFAVPTKAIHCLQSPTAPLRPPTGRGQRWRLISHLNLNHLSITDPELGLEALREILRLYSPSDNQNRSGLSELATRLIDGVVGLSSRRVLGRIGHDGEDDICRGIELTLELDRDNYVGIGPFLFASVLDRFFGLYASINSFTKLVVKTRHDAQPLREFQPRAGSQPLI